MTKKRIKFYFKTAFIFLVFVCCASFLQNDKTTNTSSSKVNSLIVNTLTYNVWGLPVWIPKIDKKSRYEHIAKSLLNKDLDIICLQEVFDAKLRKIFIPEMMDKFNFNVNSNCRNSALENCTGGLMTLSRFPIVWEKFFEHQIEKKMNVAEKTGKKGFLISKLMTDAGIIHIINTHLYAGRSDKAESIRLGQIKYIYQKIKELKLFEKPLLFLGDFNIVHPSVAKRNEAFDFSDVYEYMTTTIGFSDTVDEVYEDDYTYDYLQNNYAYKSEQSQKLDYCFYKISGKNMATLINEKVLFDKNEILSDHFGFLSTLKIDFL